MVYGKGSKNVSCLRFLNDVNYACLLNQQSTVFLLPSQSSEVSHQGFGMQYNDVLNTRQDNANRQSTRPDDDVDPRIVSKRDEDIGIVVQKMIVLHFRSSA